MKIRELSIEDTATVLRVALQHRLHSDRRTEAQTACLVHIAACCGMRIGEIMALDLEHVDLTARTIKVRRSLTTRKRLKSTKTVAGERDLGLPEHLQAMLAAWLRDFHVPNEFGLVFTNRDGSVCRHANVNKNWRRLLETAGLFDPADVYHFHALRHFAGSWWLENGMAVPDVSQLLGHANPATTMRIYIHSLTKPEQRADAMRGNAARLIGAPDALLPAPRDARVTQSELSY